MVVFRTFVRHQGFCCSPQHLTVTGSAGAYEGHNQIAASHSRPTHPKSESPDGDSLLYPNPGLASPRATKNALSRIGFGSKRIGEV
jgi:hypothetical protein